jgi:hypothetical protein
MRSSLRCHTCGNRRSRDFVASRSSRSTNRPRAPEVEVCDVCSSCRMSDAWSLGRSRKASRAARQRLMPHGDQVRRENPSPPCHQTHLSVRPDQRTAHWILATIRRLLLAVEPASRTGFPQLSSPSTAVFREASGSGDSGSRRSHARACWPLGDLHHKHCSLHFRTTVSWAVGKGASHFATTKRSLQPGKGVDLLVLRCCPPADPRPGLLGADLFEARRLFRPRTCPGT